jgi:GH35 family endo-1,4-beta-xylanase
LDPEPSIQTLLNDLRFATVLSQQFNSLSPKKEMKWVFLNPARGQYNWRSVDQLVDFAEHHDMVVKGHGLIYAAAALTSR